MQEPEQPQAPRETRSLVAARSPQPRAQAVRAELSQAQPAHSARSPKPVAQAVRAERSLVQPAPPAEWMAESAEPPAASPRQPRELAVSDPMRRPTRLRSPHPGSAFRPLPSRTARPQQLL